jgi:hypothetical protein
LALSHGHQTLRQAAILSTGAWRRFFLGSCGAALVCLAGRGRRPLLPACYRTKSNW